MSHYNELEEVLNRALKRASKEKGTIRHNNLNQSFLYQPICEINRRLGSTDGLLYQAVKKIYETKVLDKTNRVNELLDAIVYLAAAVILEEDSNE